MAEEIELKLALPEEAQRLLLRHPLLRQAVEKHTGRLTNLYYDTPDLSLRRHRMALRLRARGRQWLQTVKCAGDRAGGLSSRPEWETPYAGHFDFSAIDDPAVRDWLMRPKIARHIAPVFETNFQRIGWVFVPTPGTRIELVLDRGWIVAAGRRTAISEVELELLDGDPQALFSLALALAARVPLVPAPLSKADRGYRLFQGIADAPVKAGPVPLTADTPPLAACRIIGLACLEHLQLNHAGVFADDPVEYIHQMRIAVRRLRAALRLFSPVLPAGFADGLLAPLHELMDVLGQARDHDVLLEEIAAPVLRALPDEPRLAALVGIVTERRFARRQAALQFLRSPRHGEIVLQLLAALHGLAEKSGADGAVPALRDFAAQRLRRLRHRVRQQAAAARVERPESLHALRIGIKRLRYALEFFAPLIAAKPLQRLLEKLAALQGTLGSINDLANAGALLMACADDDARLREAVTLIGGWHGPRHQTLLADFAVQLAGLGRLNRLPLPRQT